MLQNLVMRANRLGMRGEKRRVPCAINMIVMEFNNSMIVNDVSRVINFAPSVTPQLGALP
jgi:hypothetical protein